MEMPKIKALVSKFALFSIVGILFWLLSPNAGILTYATLVILAFLWAIYEISQPKKKPLVKKALLLGLFLMVFDFIIENGGYFLGFWTSPVSIFPIIAVPIEIIALTFIGGFAWAMHLPEKPDKIYLALEVLLFGFFGALGEYLLILNGMMVYTNGWTSVLAFFGYAITWIILFTLWYKVIRKMKI